MDDAQNLGSGKWGDDWTAVPVSQHGLLHVHHGTVDVVEIYLPLLSQKVACYCWATQRGVDPPAGGCLSTGWLGAATADVSVWASQRQALMRAWYEAGNHPHDYLDRLLDDGGNGITWAIGDFHHDARLADLPGS